MPSPQVYGKEPANIPATEDEQQTIGAPHAPRRRSPVLSRLVRQAHASLAPTQLRAAAVSSHLTRSLHAVMMQTLSVVCTLQEPHALQHSSAGAGARARRLREQQLPRARGRARTRRARMHPGLRRRARRLEANGAARAVLCAGHAARA